MSEPPAATAAGRGSASASHGRVFGVLRWLLWGRRHWLAAGGDDFAVGLGAQFKRNLGLYSVGVLMVAAQQLLMAKRDFLVKAAVDALGATHGQAAVDSAILILVVSISAAVVRWMSRAAVFAGGRNVEYELRAALLNRLQRLGPSFFGDVPTGEIMSRATNDLHQVRLLLGFGVLNVISSALALASALYVMASISGRLTLAALCVWPVLALVTRSFGIQLFRRTRENQQAIGAMSDRVLSSLAGVRVVRAFAMEDSALADFDKFNRNYLVKNLRLAKLRGSMGPLMAAIGAVGVLIVFWYGGSLMLSPDPAERLSSGDFVAFWLALLRLMWPMLAVGFVASIVQRGRAGYARLRTVLEARPEVVDGELPPPEKVHGAITVRGLSYAYGERVVLDDVNFELPAGRSLAILGRTGAGKSTLAELLPRLLPTPRDTVLLDGQDICDLPLQTVRASVAFAHQDAFLFSTTVADNIAYGLTDDGGELNAEQRQRRQQRIADVAAEAQVLEDIEALPDGFHTVVGERGVQLSGGQKQRIALARALIRQPPVLVLDDPLSAVDGKTEAAILNAIERQAAERTVVLVTHRVTAAQRCDHVLVLDKGRVIEQGSPAELLAAGGLYALFAEEQQMEEALASVDGWSLPESAPEGK